LYAGSGEKYEKPKWRQKFVLRRAMELEIDHEDNGCECDVIEGLEDEYAMPELWFASMRMMRLSKDQSMPIDLTKHQASNETVPNMLSISIPGTPNKIGQNDVSNRLEELDKRLEWCQSQRESAAHMFLKSSDCGSEILGIMMRLREAKVTTEKEIERLKVEHVERGPTYFTCFLQMPVHHHLGIYSPILALEEGYRI
jgi:hypothetical protein